ncbi:MAG: MFS transporter [Bacteroidetes bacterium]|nr:MFS transporter [Bacteroidota bacterium]
MKQEKALLWTLAAINFIHIVDFMILMPLGPQLMRLFDISPSQFGFLVSSYTFSAGVSSFFGAFVLDRFDRKKILLWVYVGFTLGTLGCALSPNYAVLLLARVVSGIFGGLTSALILAIIGDVVPHERRGSAMGLVMSAFSFASVMGVPLGLFLASLSNWHLPFYILSILSVLSLGMIVKSIPSIKGHLRVAQARPHPFAVISKVTSNANQMRAITLSIMMMLGQFMIIPFLSPYNVANVGFSEMQLTYVYITGGACTIFTSPWVGKLADRKGKLKIFTIFMLLNLIPIAIITHLGVTPIGLVLLVTTLFFVTSNGRYVPAAAMITGTAQPENRGSFLSFNSSVQQLASGVASLIAGMMIGENELGQLTNFNYVGYLAIAFSLICIPLARRIQVVS